MRRDADLSARYFYRSRGRVDVSFGNKGRAQVNVFSLSQHHGSQRSRQEKSMSPRQRI